MAVDPFTFEPDFSSIATPFFSNPLYGVNPDWDFAPMDLGVSDPGWWRGSGFDVFDTLENRFVDPSTVDPAGFDPRAGVPTGGGKTPDSSGDSWLSKTIAGMKPRDWIAIALGVPTIGLGTAGLVQALSGGSSSATTTQQPNATQPSAAEQALQQGSLGGLQQALQFAFGCGGGMAGGGTPQTTAQKGQHLFTQGMEGGQLNTYEVNGQKWDEWTPSTPGAQPPQGVQIRPFPGAGGASGASGGGGGLAGLLQARQPGEMAAFQSALARLGASSPAENLGPLVSGIAGINPQLATPLALAQMGAQGSGMLQGQLPSLDPAIQSRIGDIYSARQLDVDRYLDTALSSTLERARQQGFAGGAEVLREGPPAALMAPAMAEAVRQRGTLAGQQAQSELDLAQQLPMLGSQLTTQRGNLINQQALTRLGSLSSALQGGTNLEGLNQNIIRLLGDIGQQGVGNQLGFLQAATAPLGVSGNLATQAANQRLLGAGSTTTAQQPFSLLNALGPTGSLLGGVGGILSSLYGNQGSTLNINMSGT